MHAPLHALLVMQMLYPVYRTQQVGNSGGFNPLHVGSERLSVKDPLGSNPACAAHPPPPPQDQCH